MFNLSLNNINIFWLINDFILDLVDRDFKVPINQVIKKLNAFNQSFWQYYDNAYQYPVSINAYVSSVYLASEYYYASETIWNEYNTGIFLEQLIGYSYEIRQYRQQQFNQEVHNRTTLFHYLSDLTQHYAKLLFVRVDLSYRQASHDLVTLEQFYEHLLSDNYCTIRKLALSIYKAMLGQLSKVKVKVCIVICC